MLIKLEEINFEFFVDVNEIKDKYVLLQLPDGLKPYSKKILNSIRSYTKKIILWGDSNFGACDIPLNLEQFDVILHVGHNHFKR